MYDKIQNIISEKYAEYLKNSYNLKENSISFEISFKSAINNVDMVCSYVSMLYIKYLCDQKVDTFENLIRDKNYSNVSKIIGEMIDDKNFKGLDMLRNGCFCECLSLIQYENLEELIKEFIQKRHDSELDIINAFIGQNDRVLYYLNDGIKYFGKDYLENSNIDYLKCNLDGSYRYSTDQCCKLRKMIDLMYHNVQRNYIDKIDEKISSNYDYIFINDLKPNYRYIQEKGLITEEIVNLFIGLKYKGKVILKTSYSKMNKLNDNYLIRTKLSKVIINKNKNKSVYLEFCANKVKEDKISIILIDENLETNIDKIKQILLINRCKKDVLIKIDANEIISNNYRIGFNIYQSGKESSERKVNEIVDENKRIMKSLAEINKEITEQIDILNEL